MARVWRFGQVKEVVVYRLITTGTLEETIYQRQLLKAELFRVADGNDGTGQQKQANKGKASSDKAQQFSLEEVSCKLLVLSLSFVCVTLASTPLRMPFRNSCCSRCFH